MHGNTDVIINVMAAIYDFLFIVARDWTETNFFQVL